MTTRNNEHSPDRGGVLVCTDRDDPTQGWLEMTVPLSELRLTKGATGEPMVSISFDYQSGSVCELARIVTEAHDRLAAALTPRTK